MQLNKIGSYKEEDVVFLLKNIDINETNIDEKEKYIQENKKHYSEMISKEYVPTDEYMEVFYNAMHINKEKVGLNVLQLSNYIQNEYDKPIIVSLARAGTPIGVLINRALKKYFNKDSVHYTISIIRDKEIDNNALNYILKEESHRTGLSISEVSRNIIFVDGWTGKGVINRELKKFINRYNILKGTFISNKLFVLADISGNADISATNEDYLIPSAALNSTISGLISRSILNNDYIGKNDFHGCKYYKDLEKYDLSNWYIDEIEKVIDKLDKSNIPKVIFNDINSSDLKKESENFIDMIMDTYSISNINYIKPGIGETTRVLLRRTPNIVFLKDEYSLDTLHIKKLALDRNVKIIIDKNLLYKSVGIIKDLNK